MFEFIKKVLNAKTISEIIKKEDEVEEFEFDATKAAEAAKQAQDLEEKRRVEEFKNKLEYDKKEIYKLIKAASKKGEYSVEYDIRNISGYPTTTEVLIKSHIVKEFKDRGFRVWYSDFGRNTTVRIYWNEN